MLRAAQQIYLVRRRSDGQFLHCGKSAFTDDPAQAFLVSRTKFRGLIRVDLGRDVEDFEMVEVVPSLPAPTSEEG